VAERVVLHVGAMRSGTSYVQRLLATNKELSERGVLLPGNAWRAWVRAVAGVLGRQRVATQRTLEVAGTGNRRSSG